YYWRGKALTRLGRADEARASYTSAAAVTPASYYALRAATVLGQLTTPGDASTTGTESELAQWLQARGQDLAAAQNLVASDPALLRAQAEAAIGLYREGN